VCQHQGHERDFVGTWATPELYRALDAGYALIRVGQILHFPKQRVGLFSEYVDTFLKVKQEASGWPRHVQTDEQKQNYVGEYKAREGVALDPESVVKNPGRRKTAKFCLNGLWGKHGQGSNKAQSRICTSPREFFAVILNERYDILGIHVCPTNQGLVEVCFRDKESLVDEALNTNLFVALFTTCHARLRLWDELAALGQRVLYYDTDSIIYRYAGVARWPAGALGDYLGEWTDELSDDGSVYITEFVSTGPKCYSYQDSQSNVVTKCKGITHTLNNVTRVNLVSMLDCIDNLTVIPHIKNLQFKLSRFGRIKTLQQPKIFRMVYDKRWMGPDYITYPWGFQLS
jgi:hypothetical protein